MVANTTATDVLDSASQPNGTSTKNMTWLPHNVSQPIPTSSSTAASVLSSPALNGFNAGDGAQQTRDCRGTLNAEHNKTSNIELAPFGRGMTAAMAGERPFRRLAHLKQALNHSLRRYCRPAKGGPRRGHASAEENFTRVLYISCSPETLARDLATLSATHEIESLAFLTSFIHHHLSQAVLRKKAV